MKITSHLLAMDFHNDIIKSISPISERHASDRFTGFARILDAQIPKDADASNTYKSVAARIYEHYGAQYINNFFAQYCNEELGILLRAQTVFCTEEICDEITEASESLMDTTIIRPDVFIPEGLVVLEKPYRFVSYSKTDDNFVYVEGWDITGILFSDGGPNTDKKEQVIVKIYGHWRGVWFINASKMEQGFTANYKDIADAGFVYNTDTNSIETKFAIENQGSNPHTMEKMLEIEKTIKGRELSNDRAKGTPSLVDTVFFSYGESDSVGVSKTLYGKEVLKLKKFVLAMFRMTYEYLEVEECQPPRQFQKRAIKAKRVAPENGYLVQLKLRRKLHTAGGSGSGSSPAYAFRVRGHWKKAYLRSRNLPVGDPAAYRHVYVKDYIKGRGTLVESRRVVRISD